MKETSVFCCDISNEDFSKAMKKELLEIGKSLDEINNIFDIILKDGIKEGSNVNAALAEFFSVVKQDIMSTFEHQGSSLLVAFELLINHIKDAGNVEV